MQKKTFQTIFVPLPPASEISAVTARLRLRRDALRKVRKSKLTPYLSTLSYCMKNEISLRDICTHLLELHNLKVSASAVMRFSKNNPLLRLDPEQLGQLQQANPKAVNEQ